MAQDYYSILGVSQDASPQEIKKAFRQIARECHPDVAGSDPGAEERFKTARKAYETLMDPVTRARYDRRGQRRPRGGGSFFDAFYRSMGGGESGRRRKRSTHGAHDAGGHASSRGADRDPGNDLDLDDLFNDFGNFGFGGGSETSGSRSRSSRSRSSRSSGHAQQSSRPEPRPGADVHIDLEVPARVARDGGSVTAVYYRMQRSDSWRPGSSDPGLVRIQDIADVRILPGTGEGEVLREKGLGDAGPHGGPYGDLVVRAKVVGTVEEPSADAPPADGGDRTLDISVVEALLGGRVDLDTPQGRVRLTIPPGTSSGTRMRLKARGPDGPDGRPTDLYVSTRIVVPDDLDDESRELIEGFARLNPDNPRD